MGDVSKSWSNTLIALVWVVAAGLCALTWLWPSFGHFLDGEQWPMGALTGWTAHAAWAEARRRGRI